MKLKLKVYRGFASDQKLHVSGHVFKKKDPSSFNLERGRLRNAYSMWRTFTIKTIPEVQVTLNFKGFKLDAKTNVNGYFEFKSDHNLSLSAGWHEFRVDIVKGEERISAKGELLKATAGYGIISDIDDTFLVSHSSSIFKKIYILLTKNINRRKFFHGVVKHYQELARIDDPKTQPALFFYVSSSEWNLYNFIEKFTMLHGFPKAVLFLKTIKSGIFDLLASGGGSHQHKHERIDYILNFYPERQFILLGDDSQQDPVIYNDIAKLYPKQLLAVYIRQLNRLPKLNVKELLEEVNHIGIPVCYFKDSDTAIKHSKKHGLV